MFDAKYLHPCLMLRWALSATLAKKQRSFNVLKLKTS